MHTGIDDNSFKSWNLIKALFYPPILATKKTYL